jgi:hypothetical protein
MKGWVAALFLILSPCFGDQTQVLPWAPPRIETLLKPSVYDRTLKDREVMTHASLDGNHYTYYATMLVRASASQTRSVLTNYALYSKMISYIDEAKYDLDHQILEISGGIWKFKLRSWLKFEERGPGWIHFTIIRGHFTGMTGEVLFESQGEKGTLVYLGGAQTQAEWPPKLIIEQGAQIVFGFTASRMRSYIESQKEPPKESQTKESNDQVPQPRSRL